MSEGAAKSSPRPWPLKRTIHRIVRLEGVPVVLKLTPEGLLYARRKRTRKWLCLSLAGSFRALLGEKGVQLEQTRMSL